MVEVHVPVRGKEVCAQDNLPRVCVSDVIVREKAGKPTQFHAVQKQRDDVLMTHVEATLCGVLHASQSMHPNLGGKGSVLHHRPKPIGVQHVEQGFEPANGLRCADGEDEGQDGVHVSIGVNGHVLQRGGSPVGLALTDKGTKVPPSQAFNVVPAPVDGGQQVEAMLEGARGRFGSGLGGMPPREHASGVSKGGGVACCCTRGP